jgi:DNA-binding transcriptional LysR family regulator
MVREATVAFRQGHLLYFVTVVEEGQMTRAARKLDLAQPALSQAIAQLESEVGVQLLERHPRGVALTPAGEQFYEHARLAVDAAAEAEQTVSWLARGAEGSIEFGFVGSPPTVDSPSQLEAFAEAYPDIDIHYRELPFPPTSTSSWLASVDVAVCHLPPEDPQVWRLTLRSEPRVVLAPRRHPIAARRELALAEVLDETFVGLHPSIDPAWAGFWSLDDHRGGPPAHTTDDGAANPHEVLAALASRRAITTVPATVAGLIINLLTGVVAIPLHGAGPCTIALVGHRDRRNPLVASLLAFAQVIIPGAEQETADDAPDVADRSAADERRFVRGSAGVKRPRPSKS